MEQEQQWIRQIQKKNSKKAADQLIGSYYREIYAFVYRQTLQQELAMDLTQEIFISMLRSLPGYDKKKASFRTWLYRVASSRVVDYYRSRSYQYHRRAVALEEWDGTEQEDFTLTLEYKEEAERVMALLNQWESAAQQIFRLKIFAGSTFAEIAQLLGLPESTVKTRFYTLMKSLKKQLAEEGL